MAWHYLIAHEYLSWQILPAEIQGHLPTPLPHLSHIQFIAINSPASCISYAFYRFLSLKYYPFLGVIILVVPSQIDNYHVNKCEPSKG